MKLRIALAAAALGTLAACGSNNNANNAVDMNATTDLNATDMNAVDMNAADMNGVGADTNQPAGNAATNY